MWRLSSAMPLTDVPLAPATWPLKASAIVSAMLRTRTVNHLDLARAAAEDLRKLRSRGSKPRAISIVIHHRVPNSLPESKRALDGRIGPMSEACCSRRPASPSRTPTVPAIDIPNMDRRRRDLTSASSGSRRITTSPIASPPSRPENPASASQRRATSFGWAGVGWGTGAVCGAGMPMPNTIVPVVLWKSRASTTVNVNR